MVNTTNARFIGHEAQGKALLNHVMPKWQPLGLKEHGMYWSADGGTLILALGFFSLVLYFSLHMDGVGGGEWCQRSFDTQGWQKKKLLWCEMNVSSAETPKKHCNLLMNLGLKGPKLWWTCNVVKNCASKRIERVVRNEDMKPMILIPAYDPVDSSFLGVLPGYISHNPGFWNCYLCKTGIINWQYPCCNQSNVGNWWKKDITWYNQPCLPCLQMPPFTTFHQPSTEMLHIEKHLQMEWYSSQSSCHQQIL